MRRWFLSLFLLSAIACPLSAQQIPEQVLNSDYQSCLRSVARTSHSQADKERYCACVKEEIGATMTLEEYSMLAAQIVANVPSKDVAEKIGKITTKCVAATFANQPQPSAPQTPNATNQNDPRDTETRLRNLMRLRDQNLITPAEYETQRRRILDQM